MRFIQFLGFLLGTTGTALCQTPPASDSDLTKLDLEDLMKIQVTTASKKAQSLLSVPAAMTIITSEDIARSGMRTIPDLLRLVPGFQVSQLSSSRYSVTARGFGGEFANKLLVLVDGRSIYTRLFSGVSWEDLDLDFNDIDRIEVIRGPGGSLWGANAVNGIINIITKSASKTLGNLVSVGSGSQDLANLSARHGGPVSDGSYRVYAKYLKDKELFAETRAHEMDAWSRYATGFRADLGEGKTNELSFQGQYSKTAADIPIWAPSFSPPFVRNIQGTGNYATYDFLAKLTHHDSVKVSTSAQFYFDGYDHVQPEILAHKKTFDFDLQRQAEVGLHSLVYGLGYRTDIDDTRASQVLYFLPADRTLNTYGGFLQDEITLGGKDRLTLGAKAEHDAFNGWALQPSARYSHSPNSQNTLWGSITRAVRTPSRQETDLRVPYMVYPQGPGLVELLGVGNPNFKDETVLAYEAGLRQESKNGSSFDAAVYYNVYDRLRTVQLGAPSFNPSPVPHVEVPTVYTNGGWANTAGLEISTRIAVSQKFAVRLNGDAISEHFGLHPGFIQDPGTPVQLTPRYQYSIQSDYEASNALKTNLILLYYGARPAAKERPEYRLDANFRWIFRKDAEINLSLQNLLSPRVSEVDGQSFNNTSSVPRSLYLGARYQF